MVNVRRRKLDSHNNENIENIIKICSSHCPKEFHNYQQEDRWKGGDHRFSEALVKRKRYFNFFLIFLNCFNTYDNTTKIKYN